MAGSAARRRQPVEVGERTCARCGRRMPFGAPADAKWCSAQCRRLKLTALDARLESESWNRLRTLPAGELLDPADVARAVGGAQDSRAMLEPARQAARRLVAAGRAEIVQRGHAVDASTARGPFGVRIAR